MSTPDRPGPAVPPHEKRASDDDRKKVAERLRIALDEGRLNLHEYDDRLQGAYASKTYADLDELIADIPGTAPLENSQVEPSPEPSDDVRDDQRRGHEKRHKSGAGKQTWVGIGSAAIFFTGLWVIQWLASGGGPPYYWPVWILGFWVLGAACSSWSRLMKDLTLTPAWRQFRSTR